MRVVVVGAGAFGAWTARWLRRGASVTLVDQYGPGNSLSSSGDETRVTRSAHGVDAHYAVWQRLALEQCWHWTLRCSSRPASSGWRDTTTDSRPTRPDLERLGIAAQRLETDALRERFPQMLTDDVAWALFEPDAGVLMARRGGGHGSSRGR